MKAHITFGCLKLTLIAFCFETIVTKFTKKKIVTL